VDVFRVHWEALRKARAKNGADGANLAEVMKIRIEMTKWIPHDANSSGFDDQ